jgi:hypothetical protein
MWIGIAFDTSIGVKFTVAREGKGIPVPASQAKALAGHLEAISRLHSEADAKPSLHEADRSKAQKCQRVVGEVLSLCTRTKKR